MRNNTQALLLLPSFKKEQCSKGAPDINIKILGGFTLIQWSIEACKRSKMINQFSLFKLANIFLHNGFALKFNQDIITNNNHEYELLASSDVFRQIYILVGEKLANV